MRRPLVSVLALVLLVAADQDTRADECLSSVVCAPPVALGVVAAGLLQHQASWGSVSDRMDPRSAAQLFYQRLALVLGWEALPLSVAAQRVQASAIPDAYAQWGQPANAVVGSVQGIVCGPGRPAVVRSAPQRRWVLRVTAEEPASYQGVTTQPWHSDSGASKPDGAPSAGASAGQPTRTAPPSATVGPGQLILEFFRANSHPARVPGTPNHGR
ncbi:MAG: hypothetical protein ACRDRO_30805 [Pseudonocardiaceae bacterium]